MIRHLRSLISMLAVFLVACTSGGTAQWLTYQDRDWHFSASYPSHIEGRALYVNRVPSRLPVGPESIILLSDVQSPGVHQYGMDETIRIVVLTEPVDNISLQEWTVKGWSSLGIEFKSIRIGRCPALGSDSIDAESPGRKIQGLWVSNGQNHFAVIVHYKLSREMSTVVQSILSSFTPDGCN